MHAKNTQNVHMTKAYNNLEFLNSPSARTLRILAEMLEPADRIRRNRIWNTVVFFGSARSVPRRTAASNYKKVEAKFKRAKRKTPAMKKELHLAKTQVQLGDYYDKANELAYKLTKWFHSTEMKKHNFYICSGGGPGMMEAANRGAKRAKGRSIGLNISLPMEQDPNKFQTPEISFEFHYFFIRKFWFFYLSKAMVVFPGGFGTMDELFELLTLIQTQKTKKTIPIVLFGSEFWHSVVNFEALVDWGVISTEDKKLYKIEDDVDSAFEYLQNEIRRNHHIYLTKRKK